ncbi:hypothetical protein [uncultured Rhodoblastus sp.]|uniref:hypothetical protein n=1 Tax=uncultured Rhodoblastus sp. TaxID=543037 RepID=UPI0025D81470|nr:hypothetical protein [uncultured Rhodoblastus sp.]
MVRSRLRKNLLFCLFAAHVAANFAFGAQAQTPASPAPQAAQIDRNGLLILVKSILIALDQANKTGNYTVLRDLAAPAFASANNAARLAEIFANLRRDRIDLSGVLVLEPQLTAMPEINANGMMHMAGFFPSAPTQINFEFLFAPVEGQWRLFGLAANLGSSVPVAPAPPAKPAAPAADAKKSDKKPAAEKH